LASALLVFLDPSILIKNISFSLDPAVPTNPEGPFQRKVIWPDESIGRNVLEGTEFEEVMFEADWVMKQLSLGIKVNSMNPLNIENMRYH
jgi:hypothetical protein